MNSYLFILLTIALGLNYLLIFSNSNITEIGQSILFAAVSLTFNVIFFSTILAIVGNYSLTIMNAILAVQIILILFYIKTKKYNFDIKAILFKVAKYKFNKGVVLVLLICSVLYIAFPTKYMLAGRDPGLYFLNGIHIAKTGDWQYETDKYLNENYSDIKGVVQLGYPGLFSAYDFDSISDNPGDIIPQFMPMFPSILAVGYDIGGTEALIRVNGFISILSLLSIYYFTKSFFNSKAALLTIFFMSLNPAQLWGARVTETEILSQLMFFISMHVFTIGWEKNNNKLTFISGILIGISVMNRMDSYVMGIGVYALLIYCSLFRRNKLINALYCAAAYTVSGAMSFIYGLIFSTPYFVSHWRSGQLSLIIYVNILFLALSISSIIIGSLFNKKIHKNYILEILKNRKILIGFCISLLGLFLAAYFIRPLLYNKDIYNGFNSRAMVEFCWYTSFIAVPFAIFGLYKILYYSKDNGESIFLFLLIGISTLVIYILRPSITPDHIWASRRWITINIPFVFILCSYGISSIQLKVNSNKLQILVTFIIVIYMFYQSKPFMFSTIMDNIEYQHEMLANDLENDKVYFTDNEEIASIMKFMYDKNVYYMNPNSIEGVITYLKNNEGLYYIGNKDFFDKERMKIDSELLSTHFIEGKFLDKLMGSFPRKLYDRKREASVFLLKNKLIENEDGTAILFDMDTDFYLLNGYYNKDYGYSSKGDEGIVFYGPYISLEKGIYKIIADISIQGSEDNSMKGFFDITYNNGETEITKTEFFKSGKVEMQFKLEENVDFLETRLFAYNNSIVTCKQVTLIKINN